MQVQAVPLSVENFAAYGQVLSSNNNSTSEKVNLNTADRFDFLAKPCNLRSDTAKPNFCIFKSIPQAKNPIPIRMMEKHPFSSQLFSPMNAKRYLVIVALGEDIPDLQTFAAFVATGTQGINYNPGNDDTSSLLDIGVWHHPMIALDNETDFLSFVYEAGDDDDCHAVLIDWETVTVAL